MTESGKTRGVRLAGALLAATFLIVGAAYLVRERHVLAAEVSWRLHYVVLLIVAEAAMLSVRGLLTRELCGRFQVRLGVFESLLLASWTTLANFAAPLVGGAGMRAVYLRRKHGLRYTDFASIHGSTFALQFSLAAAVGILCVATLRDLAAAARQALATAYLLVLLGGALFLAWPFRLPTSERWLARQLRRIDEGLRRIRSRRIFIVILLLLGNLGALTVSLYSTFALFGLKLPAAEILLVATASLLSLAISVTPGAFGITESVIVFVAALLSIPPPIAVAAAGLRRGASLTVTATLVAAGSRSGDKERAEP